MIIYLTKRRFRYTIDHYLAHWGQELSHVIWPVTYDQLFAMRRYPAVTYIFSDIDRLTAEETERAAAVHRMLAEARPDLRILNHPARSFRRYELLRHLYEQGTNDFNAYRVTEAREPQRYPVFLRRADEHFGAMSELLHSRQELDDALQLPAFQDAYRDNLLIVEYSGASDDGGIFRKYSAFNVGGTIIPRHVFYSRSWMIKEADTVDVDGTAEEMRYLEANPHADQLLPIFAAAQIDYGRIDYSIVGGRIQVYEINTNPMSLHFYHWFGAQRLPAQKWFGERFAAALRAIDTAESGHIARRADAWGRPVGRRIRDVFRDLFEFVVIDLFPKLGLAHRQARILMAVRLATAERQKVKEARRGLS